MGVVQSGEKIAGRLMGSEQALKEEIDGGFGCGWERRDENGTPSVVFSP